MVFEFMTPDTVADLPDAKIIPMNSSIGVDLEIRRVQNAERPCVTRHKNIVVDEKTRTITCTECGYVIDPFDYLLEWAREGDRRLQALNAIRVRQRVAEAECALLETRLKNARASLRRAGQSQPAEERQLFRHASLNWQKADEILSSLNTQAEARP